MPEEYRLPLAPLPEQIYPSFESWQEKIPINMMDWEEKDRTDEFLFCYPPPIDRLYNSHGSLLREDPAGTVEWVEDASANMLLPQSSHLHGLEMPYYNYFLPEATGWDEDIQLELLDSEDSSAMVPDLSFSSSPRPEDPDAFGPCAGISTLGDKKCLLTSPTGINSRRTRTSRKATLTLMAFAAN